MEKIIYPAVGRCIYCGALEYEPGRGSKLHEEHIIQFSLGGNLVLPESSCRNCERETHKYEGVVARTIFGNFRMRHNMRTRRRKDRPTHIEIGTKTKEGAAGTALVPVEEYPAPIFPYVFKTAGILTGKSASGPPDPLFANFSVGIASKDELDRFVRERQWDGVIRVTGVPIDLARMLAKAAYSYAVANLSLRAFTPHPLLADIILNRTVYVDFLVGGVSEAPSPQPNAGHLLTLGYHGVVPKVFVIVAIRLFGSLQMPVYHVVVGDIDFQNSEHVRTLEEHRVHHEPEEFFLPLPEIVP
jgi:hypothetical protein